MTKIKSILRPILALALMASSVARAQTTAFTYQGKLSDGGAPANGFYDLQFTLFGQPNGSSPVSVALTNTAVGITNGLFTVSLDFGPGTFTGARRWLETSVSTNGANSFATLSPRGEITSAPYAIYAGGVNASGISGAIVAGNIANGSITASKLAAGSVTAAQLAAGSVTASNLANGAVTFDKLATMASIGAPTSFTSPTPAMDELFGNSVAGMGDKVLIGACQNDTGAVNAGVAYLFNANGTLLTTFTNPTPAENDVFGWSVVGVGGDKVLIGAIRDRVGGLSAGPSVGAAYLFSTNGTLLTTFTNPAPSQLYGGEFGWAIAGVGVDKVLIGDPYNAAGAVGAGAAYLYSTNGTLMTTFTNPTPAADDAFGFSVTAIGTDKVLIGANADGTFGQNAGAAYLFSTNGTLLATLSRPAPLAGGYFGNSVAAVGSDAILIGGGNDNSAYLFRTNGSLLTTFTAPNPTAYGFGSKVASLGTDKVIIGAAYAAAGVPAAGAAYVFTTSGILLATLANPAPAVGDQFGGSLAALSADKVLVGACYKDVGVRDSGAAYVYSLGQRFIPGLAGEGVVPGSVTTASLADGTITAAKIAAGSVNATNLANGAVSFDKLATIAYQSGPTLFSNPTPALDDNFGVCVAAVGDKVLIGAHRDDAGALDAGAAYLFSANGALLTTFINPSPQAYDYFGSSLAGVGADKVLIGAYFDHAAGMSVGAAFLFSTNGALLTTFTNPTPVNGEQFGWSVFAVGSDKVIIGAPYNNTGAAGAGVAYLYSTNGSLLTTFTNPTPAANDAFGFSVAALGADKVLISANADDTFGQNAGAAYLYSTNGNLLRTLSSPTPKVSGFFGTSVAAAGPDSVLIGTWYDGAYLFRTDGVLLTTFTAPNPTAYHFGHSVAPLGTDKVVIGADADGPSLTGAAYVFSTNGVLIAAITNPTPAMNDSFGWSVAGGGNDKVLLGAQGKDIGFTNSGAAYLYYLGQRFMAGIAAEGVLPGSITALSLAAGAVTADKIAAGAVTSEKLANGAVTAAQVAAGSITSTNLAVGAVTLDNLARTAFQSGPTSLGNPTPVNGEQFGYSVAGVGAGLALIGAPFKQVGDSAAGAAYLFSPDGMLVTTFTKPYPTATDQFGFSLTGVGPDKVAIGAPNAWWWSVKGGLAYLFNTNGAWMATLVAPSGASGERFGAAIANLGADKILVGAPARQAGVPVAGAAFLFSTNGAVLATFTNRYPQANEAFGSALTAVGVDKVLIGAPGANSGAAYLFSTNGALLGAFYDPAPSLYGRFGRSLAAIGTDKVAIVGASRVHLFRTDGTLLASFATNSSGSLNLCVAAVGADRILVGSGGDYIGAPEAGAAYLFSTNGTLLMVLTNPAPAASDYFGNSVAVLGTDKLLIGAYLDDAGATDAGAAYVYSFGQYVPGLAADGVVPGAINTGSLADRSVTTSKIADGQVVKSLNGLTDNVVFQAGSNVTLTTNGNVLRLAAPSGGLNLPYLGGINSSSTAVAVNNDGPGVALHGANSGNFGELGTPDHGVFANSGGGWALKAQSAGGFPGFSIKAFLGGGNAVGSWAASLQGKTEVTGDLYVGSASQGQNHKLILRGPTQPFDETGHQDISYEFASAGSAKVRAYRGGSWDTYLQFLTTDSSAGGDNPQVRMHIAGNGNVGIGTTSPQAALDVNGTTRTGVLNITGGADLAEPFQLSNEHIPKGALVVIDEQHPGQLKLSNKPYDTTVAGIVSGANGINPGISLSQQGVLEGGHNVALSGRVYALADASNGAIKPGDLLTSSATPGHCMKATRHTKAQGAIIGKAMSSLKTGKGMVLVLVSLQ